MSKNKAWGEAEAEPESRSEARTRLREAVKPAAALAVGALVFALMVGGAWVMTFGLPGTDHQRLNKVEARLTALEAKP